MNPEDKLGRDLAGREKRKLAARRGGGPSWYGFGFFGLVGWSVALPTVLGAGLGLWLDARVRGGRSWTLGLLLAGLALGCLNAWNLLSREAGKGEGP